ncbi:tRNA splicing ligase [Halogranum tailed virus 1]|uniref:3'-phosphate/5'-hydroxy nucleic acid ligase n=1 Tax=Halogranum tailed virus 1 TaxID=1273749 RepID=R4TL89_9CAUD|nr:tRNA splicing ligase [Halogranum tailed virus 1]AGM11437.1 RtcB [Halogranum tailed virus 1]
MVPIEFGLTATFITLWPLLSSMKIEGDYNTADVKIDSVESEAKDQIQEMVDHPAFEGEGDVAIMPDTHWGAGAVIGFTMPVKNRIVPNTIGVDIGCGMFAIKLGDVDFDSLEELDSAVRERIPMGFDVHGRNGFHMGNDFPWRECVYKLDEFTEQTQFAIEEDPEDVYGLDYFKNVCKRVGYDQGRAINSVGTLGGGNHFIEFGRSEQTGDVWVIIHSGSRGIGAQIAQYWQDVATDRMNERALETEIPDSIEPYLGEDWKPKSDKIRADFEGEAIQEKFNELSQFIQETKNAESGRNTDLDYLEGEEAHGYIKDMVFAQTYASVSRKQMAVAVLDAVRSILGEDGEANEEVPVWWEDEVESVHNYIDFQDATVRKGACRAHDGERLVVPLNMSYGTLLCRGRGKDSWNNSSAHGAGRAMSRTAAHDKFDADDFEEQIGDVYMSKKPMDEIPGAYKPAEQIEAALGESVEVVDRVKPFLSIKAE